MPTVAVFRKLGVALLAAGALSAGLFAVPATASPSGPDAPDAPCYNGVFPLNPYVDNCGLQPRPHRTLGSAPDQTAILNCNIGNWRAECLSLYVNGGYGMYPGATLAPGYHP